MDDRTLATLAEDNMITAIGCWARAAGGEMFDDGDIHASTAPVPMRSFNQIIVRRPIQDISALRAAVSHYRGSDRLRLRFLPDVRLTADQLAQVHFVRRGGIPSMILGTPTRQDVAGLDVRRIDDKATLDDHVGLVAGAFDWDSPDLASVFTPRLITDQAWLGWVGYRNGEPVTTAQLVVDDHTAGIYYVATAEDHRGKGYGALITLCAIAEAAKRSCSIVGLQASPLGRPVYESLGFRVVAEYETYVVG